MFIRETKTKNKKTGKKYVKHVLIESYRSKNGPRHRVIMQLGRLDLPKKLWPALAAELESLLAGTKQLSIFKQCKAVCKTADEAMRHYHFVQNRKTRKRERWDNRQLETVDLNTATTGYSRSLGPELVGHHVWRDLQFPRILEKCGLSPRERSLAEAVVLGRLIQPGSDLATWRWIRNQTALVEMTEVSIESVKKDAVYEIADQLLKHKIPIEKHLLKREKELFPDRDTLYLFDLTNFFMEGQCRKNTLAARGKSKDKRSDCCLVSLALVVDSQGFPITSRVYEGNISEPSTLKDILYDMRFLPEEEQQELLKTKPTLVMDRGLATRDNLAFIRHHKFPYVIIERGPKEKGYADIFTAFPEGFEPIRRAGRQDVWVRKVAGPDEETARVLCMSEGRKAKEKAIADRWEERARDDLVRFQNSIANGYIKAIDKVNQRLGRIMERYRGFNKRFEVIVEPGEDGRNADKLTWKYISVDNEEGEVEPLHGCYVIETSHANKEAIDIWNLYMTLERVEEAFHSLKGDLGTRPINHQLAPRTEAHLFTSVMAYHILIYTESRLSKKVDHRRWETIRTVLQTHRRNTIIITDEKDIIHHIRQSGQAEPCHLEIYKKLGIKDPLRRNHYRVGRRV